MDKKSLPNLLYLCVHDRIKSKVNGDNIIDRRVVFEIFGRLYHIPKKLRYPVLKEMAHMNLIDCLTQNEIKVFEAPFNIHNTWKVQKLLKFY